jgi:ribosomal protein S20
MSKLLVGHVEAAEWLATVPPDCPARAVWAMMPLGQWAIHVVGELSIRGLIPRSVITKAAVAAARTASECLPEDASAARKAILTASLWCDGKARQSDVRSAVKAVDAYIANNNAHGSAMCAVFSAADAADSAIVHSIGGAIDSAERAAERASMLHTHRYAFAAKKVRDAVSREIQWRDIEKAIRICVKTKLDAQAQA